MGHSPCVYFRLFTLSQGETAILGRSARCAIFFQLWNTSITPRCARVANEGFVLYIGGDYSLHRKNVGLLV